METSVDPEELPLVKKGKDCFALAQNVCCDVNNKSIDDVEQELQSLRRDAEELYRYAEKKAKEIEEVVKQYNEKTRDIKRMIGELGLKEEELSMQKSAVEISLSGKQSRLDSMRQTLSNAESDLRAAEGKLRNARRAELSSRVGSGAVIGAFIGTIFAPGLGTVAGAAAGAGIGGTINVLINEERAARNRVDDHRRMCRHAESDVMSTQSAIHNIQSQITIVSSQSAHLIHQQQEYAVKSKEMNEALIFFQQAALVWRDLQQAAKEAHESTERMEAIVRKAKEEQDWKYLMSDGSIESGVAFIKAWEMVHVATRCACK
jgi:uncharacterized protein YcfJ